MTKPAFQTWNSTNAETTTPGGPIVVAGEFEVGKSSVVNALVRRTLIPNDPGFVNRPLVRVRHALNTIVHAELVDGSFLEAGSIAEIVEREDVVVCTLYTPLPGMEAVEIVEIPFSPVSGFDPNHLPIMQGSSLFIWVTIASQAWRLSEKTVVQGLPDEMRERSVLAITRADKLRSEEDLDRIETRLQKEAAPFFNELVFVQASARNLTASETNEAGWTVTGGQALFEIATEVIGGLGAEEGAVAPEISQANYARSTSDRVGVDLDRSEMEMVERELDEKFRTVDELPNGARSATATSAVSSSFDDELEDSLNEILEQFGSEEPKEVDTADNAEVDDAHESFDAGEAPAETSDEEAFEPAQIHATPVVESTEVEPEPEPEPEPIPETSAEKISRATDSIDGLVTAGVGDLDSLEVQVSFKEHTVSANQCLAAFSGMLEADAGAMKKLRADDTIQEVIIAAGNSLILLQMLDESETELAFFVLQSAQTNAGISSMQAKRLLSVWQECRDDI